MVVGVCDSSSVFWCFACPFQMSGNLISTFESVDALKPLGSLTCLYLEHNPLYT